MSVTAIVGANWGDEGKGKITDVLASESDYVVRFQGGSNAGHTIINDHGTFALHLIPAGAFYDTVTNVLGPGVALGIGALFFELDELAASGIDPNVYVSDRAQILLPYHKLLDELEEDRLADRKYGSTRSGIAPFYADKYQKIGVQVADIFDAGRFSCGGVGLFWRLHSGLRRRGWRWFCRLYRVRRLRFSGEPRRHRGLQRHRR